MFARMRLLKLVILVLVVLAVFGGAAFFGYKLFVEPIELDREAEIAQENAPPPTPLPDYSIPRFEEAAARAESSSVPERQEIWRDFIAAYPKSTKIGDAKSALGRINVDQIFADEESPKKVPYTVVSGDSLLRIAGKTDSNGELIMRANNLLSIDLRIGQKLLIPKVAAAIFVDREAKTLTLLDDGNFFKEYPVLSIKASGTPVDTKVSDRLAMRGSDRVAFGSRDYASAERWLMLDDGDTIRGVVREADGSLPASLPPGIVLANEDMTEIFPLVSRGTPVTIQ